MVLPSYQQYSYICNLITLHLNKLSLSNQYPADKSLKNTLPSLCPSRKVAGDMMLCIVMLCYGCERFCSYPLSLQQLQGFLPLFSATCLRNDLNHQLSQHLWASQTFLSYCAHDCQGVLSTSSSQPQKISFEDLTPGFDRSMKQSATSSVAGSRYKGQAAQSILLLCQARPFGWRGGVHLCPQSKRIVKMNKI